MKILVLSRHYYPYLGGGEVVLRQIFAGLTQRGHKIYVITSKLDNSPEHEEVDGIEIYRPLDAMSMLKGIGFSVRLFSYLKYFLKNNHVDIMFNVAYICIIPANRMAHKTHIPSVTYVTYFFGKTWFKLVNPFFAILNCLYSIINLYFGNSDIICCPSKIVSKNLGRYTKSKLVVIPSPIDASEIKQINESIVSSEIRLKLGIENDQLFLVFVGRLAPEKNVVKLIKTLKTVDIDFKLIIVGDGPQKSEIEMLVNNLNLTYKVRLLGRRSHEDTLRIIKASDILILSSKTENFPTVVLEALAMEKPVISTRVGGVLEMDSPNLHLIDNLDEIKKISLRNIKAKPDPNFIERYSLENIISSFEAMFKECLQI